MNPDRWRQIDDLFNAALERSPEARLSFLKQSCGDDLELMREVESLLNQEEFAAGFLETRSDVSNREQSQTKNTPPLIGCQLGPYRIASLLGAGGMGEVYRAHDSKLGRDVALKVLATSFARNPEWLSRFQREARTLASLNHPNIASIYGLEESGEVACLVLELVEGETLHGPVPIGKALDYAGQVAEALKAAHRKGIVHCDLKPANVKVSPEGLVKVLDFGLAKAMSGEDEQDLSQLGTSVKFETMTGHIVGTPAYVSPERARGRSVDARTDIWAFGCLIYELLTGRRAFPGKTLCETIDAVVGQEPDWSALPQTTPPKIRELLRRCLEKDQGRRLADIEEAAKIVHEVASSPRRPRSRKLTLAIAILLLPVAIAAVWMRRSPQLADRSEWVQLTHFQDSVGQPALSPDNRMVAFVRGIGTFYTPGQVYVKALPDGEAKQLTDDDHEKMSPVFSPDGSRIAYTTVDLSTMWYTWVVPVQGGPPKPWLPNASGLVWKDTRTLLFSEIKKGTNMAIVAASEERADSRDLYVPEHQSGMAHRSYPSPDGKSLLIAEMDDARWLPCRLVPADGSSRGRSVGPPTGACTYAAWSPDGKWMYFSSSASGAFHTWRQRFPNGTAELVTSGPTEEEGIAMASDGNSFITAVGQRQRMVMLHESGRDRQVSLEGYAYQPKFTPDGKFLVYRILRGSQPYSDPTELWVTDLASGHAERLLPEIQMIGSAGYDISSDGSQVAVAARGRDGKDRIWLVPLDRRLSPRQIPGVEGDWVVFGATEEIFFRSTDGFAYRVREDGTALSKVFPEPILKVEGVSPDKRWLVLTEAVTIICPLKGGPAIRLDGEVPVKWSADGKRLYASWARGGETVRSTGRTAVIPLPDGQMLPNIAESQFTSEQDVLKLPKVQVIEAADVAPGPTADIYAFSRETTQRNLFRIPIP